MKLSDEAKKYTSWQPELGWLFLLPSRLPSKQGEIILPESHTKKNNSGICFAAQVKFGEEATYLDKECLFPDHAQHNVKDTDTGYEFYVIAAENIIMTRTPPDEILRVSREKESDAPKFQTLEPSIKKDQ